MRTLVLAVGLLLISGYSWAGQRFPCGTATVSISVSEVKSTRWELRTKTTVTVSSPAGASVDIGFIGRIDFVGGSCVTDASGKSRVLFQAYCAGSACKDLDNWGIVDPESLQILLAPHDANTAVASRILGAAPTRPKEMISVYAEAKRLGIEVP